jgi:nucleotide-binding universal stress UspA family protein
LPRLDRIVVGVDFSEPGLIAARWTMQQFKDADLILCNVVNIPQPPVFLRPFLGSIEDEFESARRGAEVRLLEIAKRNGSAARVAVRSGRPADEICGLANEENADLIVVGEHGARRGLWNVLGSTAEHLIRLSHIPVMLARGLPTDAPHRILAPVDYSEFADAVLAWAGFLAAHFNGRIVAFHSIGKSYFGSLRMTSSTRKADEIQKDVIGAAREWLLQKVDAAGLSDLVDVADVVVGDPSYEIIAAAKRLDADLIVLGGRGSGAISHALLGSVARAILRGGADPVLVVPEPGERE